MSEKRITVELDCSDWHRLNEAASQRDAYREEVREQGATIAELLRALDASNAALRSFAEKGRDLRPKAAAFRALGAQFGTLPLDAWLKAADLLYPEEKKP